MKAPWALGNQKGLSRQNAQGCVATNLGLPGFGSVMAGRAVGYLQATLTLAGFVLTLLFGLKFILWCLRHWSEIYGAQADPLETWLALWRELRWALFGIILFVLAWLWALATNLGIMNQVRQEEAASKPQERN
jgi:hypothetical protein